MKEAVVLMRFLRQDRVGQRLGVAVLVIAWLAVAWTSLLFAAAVPLLLAVPEKIPGTPALKMIGVLIPHPVKSPRTASGDNATAGLSVLTTSITKKVEMVP